MSQHTPFPAPATTDSAPLVNQLLQFFEGLLPAPAPEGMLPVGRGRPVTLQTAHLLLACVLLMIRKSFTPAQIARTVLIESVGAFAPLLAVSRQLVRQRLLALGLAPFTELLQRVQDALSGHSPHPSACQLAPFASSIVAVDQCELSAVAQLCEETRVLPKKSERLLVGKLSAIFDVGRQQWRHVQLLSDAFGDGTLNALLLLEDLPTGSLILADLGYFGFQWFQYLSDQGHFWISRLKSKTRYQIQHVLYQQDDTLDALVWLGVYRSNQYPYLVRLVQYRHGQQLFQYVTNVLDPVRLPLPNVVRLYARRWDIEMAFKLLKRTLGLHLWWACERVLVLQQLLLTLALAQVIHFLQGEIAQEAGVEPVEVSVDILMKVLPQAQWPSPFGLAQCLVSHARQIGLIRPSRSIPLELPQIPLHEIIAPALDMPCVRPAKRTVRKTPRHPRRTDPFDFRFFPLLLI
jgi:Transposase DDE domain